MSKKSITVAFWASLLYSLVAGLWILFSDRLLGEFIRDPEQLTQMEIYKGWAFVVTTGSLLFFILRRSLEKESQKIEQLKKAEALTRLQNETLQMIAGGRPLQETLDTLLRGVEALSPAARASILLLEADGLHLRHGAAPSLPAEYIRAIDGAAIGPNAGSCGTAAFRGSPVFTSDIAHDPLWADYKHLALPHGLASCWSTPILDEQKKVLGTFAVYHPAPGLPQAGDVAVIELVTHTAATAIIKERAEKKLRGSEERFRTLVEQASDAIFVHDAEGRLLDANQSACQCLGYSRKELLRMTVMDIAEGIRLAEMRQLWQELQPGQSQMVRGRHRRKDGTSFPVEISLTTYEIQGQRVFAALVRNISERREYEDQLAQSVSLLRATIESSGSGLLVVDTEGKITTYNNRFLEMWQIPAEVAALGDDVVLLKLVLEQLQSPEDFLRRVQELYARPEEESYDTLYFKDGRIFDRVSRPQRLGNKIIGRVWSFRDVTERMRAEQKLTASEESYRNFFNTIGDAIYVLDEAGKFLAVNDGAVAMYGHTRETFIGRTPEFLSAPGRNDLATIPPLLQRAFAGEPQQFNWWGLRKNGEIFPKEVRLQKGTYFGRTVVFASGRDITQRQQAEAALEHERQLLRTLIDLAPDFIFVKDTESRYLVVNEALAKCYCHPPAKMLNHTDADFLSAELAARFRTSELKVLAADSFCSYEDTVTFPDGQPRTVVTNMVAFRDPQGNIAGLVGIGHDITKQQRAEKSMRLQSFALEAAANAIVITDPHGNIEWANPAFSASSGYALAECLGKNPRELVRSGQHSKEFYQAMWQTILAGNVWHGELTNRRKDGSFYLEEMTITPLHDGLNRITHFVAIKQDITERKKTVEALATSQALYSSLVGQMPAGVFRKDAEGRFVFINSRFCELEHLKPEEIIGRDAKELAEYKLQLAREKRQYIGDINEINYLKIGFEHHKTIMATGQTVEIIEEYTLPAGEKRFFQALKSPVFDSNKKIIGSQGVVFDITENRRTSEKLRQADERTKFYMDRMPLAFIAFDRDFRVAEWNHAAEEIFGWSTAEAMGQHAYQLIVPPEAQPQVNRVWADVLHGGSIASNSVNENVTKNGRRITCEWQNTPWRDADGQICGSLSIVTDITDKLRMDKERQNLETQLRQSQKMEAVGQLSGGIAHDFNNILTVIQGNAALLQGLNLQPAEIRDCSDQIARAGDRAAGLTRQLLMFARKQQMQPVNLDLNETVAQMTKMLQRILGEDIALRAEYSPALPPIHADIGMIEQIILNLAVNARDAMPGGGKLTIRTKVENFQPAARGTTGPAQTHVCLTITDTGAGIAPEILPRIFEPFFTTKEVGKGTGLGLATVYGIMQQHHGEITVQSEPGKGASFNVYFPVAPAPVAGKTAAPTRKVLPSGNETILLVEDEFPLLTFVSELLQRCGYTVLEAGSGPAALKIWQEHRDRISLVVTDIIMPENVNGIELGRQLLAEKPALKIIYISGYTGNLEGHLSTLTEGVNFLRKPFKPEAIAELIRKNLDGKNGGK